MTKKQQQGSAPETTTPPAPPPETQSEAVVLVKMVRNPETNPEPPYEADVHPDEVANYAQGGWEVDSSGG